MSDASDIPTERKASVLAQLRSWAALRRLHPRAIELERVYWLREATPEQLASPEAMTDIVRALGLNDEGIEEFPSHLHDAFGGLRIWQYPEQFGPYLSHLAQLGIGSYLEIGVRHGGAFVATVEVLRRVGSLSRAVAVDLIPAPALTTYAARHPEVQTAWLDSRSEAFRELLQAEGPFDLVFVDSHHEEAHCRRELELISEHARAIALHDITHQGWPEIANVWRDFQTSPDWDCTEFTAQYEGLGPFMGIGLAVQHGKRG